MLSHPWLTMPDNYDYKMNEMEYKLYDLKEQAFYIDNFSPDINYLMEYKANLMNPNTQHHLQIDTDRLDMMIKQKERESGSMGYKYPGILVSEDEDENNAGDEISVYDDQSDNEYLKLLRI